MNVINGESGESKTIIISPIGFEMLMMSMLLDQMKLCCAAIAEGHEMVTLLDLAAAV